MYKTVLVWIPTYSYFFYSHIIPLKYHSTSDSLLCTAVYQFSILLHFVESQTIDKPIMVCQGIPRLISNYISFDICCAFQQTLLWSKPNIF